MPQSGGAFAGLVSGLVSGFGKEYRNIEQQKHEDNIRDKQTRISILQHAIDSGTLDDDSMQAATDQLGEIIDGKPGGKTSEKLKALLDPILAVGKLMGGVKTPAAPGTNENFGGTQRPSAPPPGGGGFEIPSAPRPGQSAPSNAIAQVQGVTPAPRKMTVKTKAQRQQEALDLDKARILQQYALGDEEKARQLANLPKETAAKVDANIAVARKYYRVRDKDNPNGRPLRDDEALPDAYTQAILEESGVMNQPRAAGSQTVKAIGRVEGKNLPADAKTVTGEPITDAERKTGAYLPVYRGDELLGYQREDKKMLASEVKLAQDIDDAMSANPKLSRDDATKLVRNQNFQARRLNIVNAQELASGRQLSNQMRKDILDGKVTPATARAAMASIRSEAQTFARADKDGSLDPSSPYAGKSAPEIEEMLIPLYGYSKDELLKAIGGKTDATVPAAPRGPGSTARPALNSFEGR